jgi:4-amino-4-deoxy-L-arabinose transferase-like glycosyltransferase
MIAQRFSPENKIRIAAKIAVFVFGGYWLLVAILLPATNYDGQTYNLARLLLNSKYGFWARWAYNSERQLFFPWTFDAIHWPLLSSGWFLALPSFFAFLGLLFVVFRYLEATGSSALAWIGCLAFLAMPTFVYQATTNKPDMALTFGLAVAAYSVWLYSRKGTVTYVAMAAIALAFAAGCKTTGILLGIPVAFFLFYLLRRDGRAIIVYLVSLVVAGLLLAGPEIYIRNSRIFDSALGPRSTVRAHSNQDGIAGAAANFIRYNFDIVSDGIDGATFQTPLSWCIGAIADKSLRLLHIHDAGYGLNLRERDANIQIRKNGQDDSSDFGLPGTVFLGASYVVILFWVFRKTKFNPAVGWSLAGFAVLAVMSASIAWMPWNNRFLLPALTCFAIAFTKFLGTSNPPTRLLWIVWPMLVVSGVLAIVGAATRQPSDLVLAVIERDRATFEERPELLPIYRFIRDQRSERPVYFVAGEDGWAYSFLSLPGLTWEAAPTRERLETLFKTENRPALVLESDSTIAENEPGVHLIINASRVKLYEFKP